jgi:hypothetical protein
MASRGQSITLYYYAWNVVDSIPETGDVGNHTLRLVKDGGSGAPPSNSPTEIDSTNLKGWYQVTLLSAETTANSILLGGVSSTSGVVLCGTEVTLEQLPTAAPAASAGLLTFGSGAGQINPNGSGLVPATLAASNVTGNLPATLAASNVTGNLPVNLMTIVGQTVTCGSGVTINAQVGSSYEIAVNASNQVSIATGQTLTAARALDSVADTNLTLNDAFHCAISGSAGKESIVGTIYVTQTPSTGTTLRTFTLNSASAPTSRS